MTSTMKIISSDKIDGLLSSEQSQNSALDETFVDDYEEEPSTPSPDSKRTEVNTPATVDRFTRKVLDETFGKGTSAQGFTKQGIKTSDPVASSPAVKNGLVKVCKDGTIDQRSAAVKQGLVVVDSDGGVIKKESILCQKQIVFTPTGNISKTSAAVESGLLLLKKDGQVDKRSSAVKKGLVEFDASGAVDLKKSALFQPQQLHLKETNGAHIFGFELADKLTQLGDLQFTKDEASRMVFAINHNGNVRLKTRGGNMSESITGAKGSGDLAVDRVILTATDQAAKSNEPVSLKKNVAERVGRVIQEILCGDYPINMKEQARQVFNNMLDENGHKIVRANAKLTTPEGAEAYHVFTKTPTTVKTVKTSAVQTSSDSKPSLSSAKNLSSEFDDAAVEKASAKSAAVQQRERGERVAEQEKLLQKVREKAAVLQKERERVAERERMAEQQRREQQERENQQRERERAAEQQRDRERAAEQQRRVREQQEREEAAARYREQQLREQAAEQQRVANVYRQQTSYSDGGGYSYGGSSSYSNYGGNGGYGGYATQSSGLSHSGRRCIDGSLDMRCSENRGYSKYG